jgi:hypothetical protein
MWSRCLEEIYILFRVVLAIDKLVYLLLATKEVRVSLEEALPQIIEDW